jgi:hypothetical protein
MRARDGTSTGATAFDHWQSGLVELDLHGEFPQIVRILHAAADQTSLSVNLH